MNIVVLGAKGQIGSTIFNCLRKESGMNVIGTSRKPDERFLTFDPFKDDWSLLGKADVIINCIGIIQESMNETYQRTHIDLVHLILIHRALLGDPKIIQISALGACIDHEVEFLRTKGIGDELLMKHGDIIVIRPSIVCTPNTMMVQKLKLVKRIAKWTRGKIIIPKGLFDKNIQPVMADDLTALVKAVCFSNPIQIIIDLVGAEKLNYKQLFGFLKMKNGKSLRVFQISKMWIDIILKVSIFHFCPRIINKEQYLLLFKDNISSNTLAEKIIGRPLLTTISFWQNQLN